MNPRPRNISTVMKSISPEQKSRLKEMLNPKSNVVFVKFGA